MSRTLTATALLFAGAAAALPAPRAHAAPARAAAPVAGTWHALLEGGVQRRTSYDDGQLSYRSNSTYHASIRLSFTVRPDGSIEGSGDGEYSAALWHLEGVNGSQGSFSCQPPVTARPFTAAVSGHVTAGRAQLQVDLSRSGEANADYDCGAHFTGFATVSRYLADAWRMAAPGGASFDVASAGVAPLTAHEARDGTPRSTSVDTTWYVTLTPPADGAPGPGDSDGSPAAGGACSARPGLHVLGVDPSRPVSGRRVQVRYRLGHAAHVTLEVQRGHGTPHAVASRAGHAGADVIAWNGRLGGRPAAPGRYVLIVHARACGGVEGGARWIRIVRAG